MAITKRTPNEIRNSYEISGQNFTFASGILAPQADSAVTVQFGDNVLLFTVVMEKHPRPELDFLPLTIDYREMFSAGGKIGGAAYRRREAKPSDNCILYARLTDRALRPLFPKGMINPVVISVTPLSLDGTQDLWVMSLIGSSLATMMAWIPLKWPVGAVRIGRIDGEFIINPTLEQIETGEMNLICAGKKWSINMIELDAKQVSDEIIKQAFLLAQTKIDEMCDIQSQYLTSFSVTPREVVYNKPSQALLDYVRNLYSDEIKDGMIGNTKVSFNDKFYEFERMVMEDAKASIEDDTIEDFTTSKVKMAVFQVIKDVIRDRTLHEGLRVDNRSMTDIRPLFTQVDTVPRVHGSGLFRRWDTQVLSTVTLGSPWDALLIDDMEHTDKEQRYFHHYNFPPFSTWDAQAIRFLSRREVGHGKLAEKALEHVLPSKEEFGYTIRVVSDCLASGGSTSMGATCWSTLSLLAAGVPLKAPVSGVAMGLMTEQNDEGHITNYKILTDLMGTEDFIGDMDFKVAGTRDGITAIQLDTKVGGLTMEIIHNTIDLAHTGRNEIMDVMLETIPTHRPQLSPYAPKMVVFKINPDKVKMVIGKGGEMIDKIIELSGGVKIDFEDDGTCYVAHMDQDKIDKAIELIKDIAEDLPLNTVIEGKIAKVEAFWFFVDLPKKQSGLIHVSQLGELGKPTVSAHFKPGQFVKVIATGTDDKGRLQLKMAS